MSIKLDILETDIWVESKNGALDLSLLSPLAQPYREIISESNAKYAFNTSKKFFLIGRLKRFEFALRKWRQTSIIKVSADIPIFFDKALSAQTYSVDLKILATILKMSDELDVAIYMTDPIITP